MTKQDIFQICACILLLATIFGCIFLSSWYKCTQKSVSFDDHQYKLFVGCMVKHKDRWLPLDNIRGFDGK